MPREDSVWGLGGGGDLLAVSLMAGADAAVNDGRRFLEEFLDDRRPVDDIWLSERRRLFWWEVFPGIPD